MAVDVLRGLFAPVVELGHDPPPGGMNPTSGLIEQAQIRVLIQNSLALV